MRPKSTEPIKDITLRVRVTPAEHQALERIIKLEGLGKSEVLRLLLQEGARNRGIIASVPGLASTR